MDLVLFCATGAFRENKANKLKWPHIESSPWCPETPHADSLRGSASSTRSLQDAHRLTSAKYKLTESDQICMQAGHREGWSAETKPTGFDPGGLQVLGLFDREDILPKNYMLKKEKIE